MLAKKGAVAPWQSGRRVDHRLIGTRFQPVTERHATIASLQCQPTSERPSTCNRQAPPLDALLRCPHNHGVSPAASPRARGWV